MRFFFYPRHHTPDCGSIVQLGPGRLPFWGRLSKLEGTIRLLIKGKSYVIGLFFPAPPHAGETKRIANLGVSANVCENLPRNFETNRWLLIDQIRWMPSIRMTILASVSKECRASYRYPLIGVQLSTLGFVL